VAVRHEDARLARLTESLPAVVPDFLMRQRWFGGKAHAIQSAEVLDAIPAGDDCLFAGVFLVRVQLNGADSQTYTLPLAAVSPERETALKSEGRGNLLLRVRGPNPGEEEVWCDALWDRKWPQLLLDTIAEGRAFRGSGSEFRGVPTRAFPRLRGGPKHDLESSVMSAEQSNTSVRFGNRLILKLFRRLQTGVNPDVEICTFLTERTSFTHFPAVGGSLIYRKGGGDTSLAILQAFVPNQGDAWKYTLDSLGAYFERIGSSPHRPAPPVAPLSSLIAEGAPPSVEAAMDGYLASARLLGERTAELHLALASAPDDPAFEPEPFSPSYQRGLCEFMLDLSAGVFGLLRSRMNQLGAGVREQAAEVLQRERDVVGRLRSILDRRIAAMRARIHGDYHLGQVLCTGHDFCIIDFEGEPTRPLDDRRIKQSPLRDVAGMLRSFHYAAFTAFLRRSAGANQGSQAAALEPWARHWHTWASAAFLGAYLSAAQGAAFLPKEAEDREMLLQTFLLEKAVFELGYELNNRPDWVKIPLQGIQDVLRERLGATYPSPLY